MAATALIVLVGGALLLTPRADDSTSASSPSVTAANATAIERARERLTRLPKDWQTWAQLGLAYLEQARATGDPARYAEAEQALRKSLAVRPADNAEAVVGLGALAAARHRFTEALRLGRQAVGIDAYSASARGVVADALIELGRYDEAWKAVQAMVDLHPDTGSYARASYTWQLRGDTARATDLMTQALQAAPDTAQAAFALQHLAGLAFDRGDLTTATVHVAEGLRRLPDHPPLLAVRARIAAAQSGPGGDLTAARADWAAVVTKLPLPAYAAEYGDLLAAAGDPAGAKQQYDLVATAAALQSAQGVDVDLELAAFQADHAGADRAKAAKALATAQAAYDRRPTIGAADTLAWALHTAGRDREALTYADEALRLNTKDAMLHYHRGMIAAGLAEAKPALRTAARRDLNTALALNPQFSPRHTPIARRTLAELGGAG